MPYPWQVLKALNAATGELGLKSAGSLMHIYETDGKNSCMSFAGAQLEALLNQGMQSEYSNSNNLGPAADTPEGTFFHFAIIGEPSSANHGFCVFFHDNIAVLMQVFLDKEVLMIRRLGRGDFLGSLGKLRTGNAQEAYDELFGAQIDPFTVQTIHTTRVLP